MIQITGARTCVPLFCLRHALPGAKKNEEPNEIPPDQPCNTP